MRPLKAIWELPSPSEKRRPAVTAVLLHQGNLKEFSALLLENISVKKDLPAVDSKVSE